MGMNIKIVILLTTLFIFGTEMSFAQKQWTLDECINYALQNNLEIESQRITTKTSKENFEQSKRNRLPQINAGSGYSINFGKSVDPNTNSVTYNSFASNSYSLQGGISLFDGFVRNNQIAYSRFMLLAGIENEKVVKIDIAFGVMNAFHNSLYYKGLLDIVKEQKALSEMNLEKIEKQAEVGISAKTDILEIEARLADEELLVIRTQNNLKASILELKRTMNFPASEELELKQISDIDFIEATVFENADTVYSMALEHLPSLKAKHQQLMAVERSLSIAKGSLYPSLSLSGGYYTGFHETRTDDQGNTISFRDQIKNNASQSISLSLSIPIFSRWNSRSAIKINKLELEKEKVELENFKNQLYYEIESYCQELSAVSAEYLQAKKQTESNWLAYEVAQKKKEQGLFNVIDFYTSKNLLSNALGELLRTKMEYLVKRKTIDFYMGKPVFKNVTE
ncbi:TolC family protein [Mariniphaga sediminis]|uniref:TolC family protein n=2 Tax=Mariniphaga sediminis TaxID=1628158 RepID=A0A399D4G3_9BACT|nr:TolC family protein [Mariniphaga sediminis]